MGSPGGEELQHQRKQWFSSSTPNHFIEINVHGDVETICSWGQEVI